MFCIANVNAAAMDHDLYLLTFHIHSAQWNNNVYVYIYLPKNKIKIALSWDVMFCIAIQPCGYGYSGGSHKRASTASGLLWWSLELLSA